MSNLFFAQSDSFFCVENLNSYFIKTANIPVNGNVAVNMK